MRPLPIAAAAALIAAAAAAQAPHIDSVKPSSIVAGQTTEITLHGTFPLGGEAYRDRSQYEHWAVRRADSDGGWHQCTGDVCEMRGWTPGTQTLRLSGPLVEKPGVIEIKVCEGRREVGPDSNIVRVPVLDADLATRVRRAIAKQLPDQAKLLKVSAAGGAVTLTGSFYPETEQRITSIVKRIDGVKSVKWKTR